MRYLPKLLILCLQFLKNILFFRYICQQHSIVLLPINKSINEIPAIRNVRPAFYLVVGVFGNLILSYQSLHLIL